MADLPAPKPTSSLRMMATLGIAGGLSGLLLVLTSQATAPRIERNRAEALEAAVYRVLPGASARVAWAERGGAMARLADPAEAAKGEELVWEGLDGAGSRVGFAIPAAGNGFQDTIGLLYGYDPAKRALVGMEVLESKETPGLGDKIMKDAHFVGQFAGAAFDPELVLVKKGTGSGASNEIDAISGATISSKAVVKIINGGNQRWAAPLAAAAEAR